MFVNTRLVLMLLAVLPLRFSVTAQQPTGDLEAQKALGGLSALLTTTMPAMKDAVAKMRAAGLAAVKVIVGGAPITQEFANEIGADGYAPDAATAVDVARECVY